MTSIKSSLPEKAIRLLYPRACPVCGDILTLKEQEKLAAEEKNPYICPECMEKLDFLNGRRCFICSKPLESEEDELCRECQTVKRHFDSGYALLRHDDEARKIIYGLKYSGIRDNADFIAFEIAKRAGRLISMWQPEAFIPVPLHKVRRRERGFNQAEVIAEKLSYNLRQSGECNVPVDDSYIIRSHRTAPQKGLDPHGRRSNVRGAFEISEKAEPGRYKTVMIIDDIFTTGATISEMAKILRKTGVSKVYFVTCSIVG